MSNPVGWNLEKYLRTPSDYEKVNEIGYQIFKLGKFELLDEFILLVLPIIHSVYCNSILRHDDRAYARDDLIQEAVLVLYDDMKYRWDKYIYVDNYAEYIKSVVYNVMLRTSYSYHNQYNTVEYDPEMSDINVVGDSILSVESKVVLESFYSTVNDVAMKIANYRVPYNKVVQALIKRQYIDRNPDVSKLKSRFKVIGVNHGLFIFLHSHSYYVYRLAYNYVSAEVKGNKKMVSRINQIVERMKDPMYELLSRKYSGTILPEIYAEFGQDITERFVKTFSGQSITVPSYKEFSDDMLGSIVYTIAEGDESNLKRFSDACGLPYTTILRIYNNYVDYLKLKGEIV